MQLRLYDQLPGLPSGQGAISGVGEGALCMACHNGRNGEHTDTVNSSPYAETPHDSTATEALFGFNAFFVPRYSPSPHLAIQDTCAGCHVKIPTASEADAGFTSNHAFKTDLSICKTCHGSASVDGAAIQSQVATEMAALNTAITGGVSATVLAANAVPLCVQVGSISDAKCTGGSCKSSQVVPAVPFPTPPSNVVIPANGIASVSGTSSLTINLKAGLNIPYYDPLDVNMQTVIGTTAGLKKLSVSSYTMFPLPAGTTTCNGVAGQAGNTPVFPASGILAKAIWNYNSLNNEGSGGIHNFPWTNQVIQATMAQLSTVPGATGAWVP
jgi:hypothetical protein